MNNEAGGDREKLSDHGINFAVTAWHLTDWVWRDIKGRHKLKTRIATAVGVPLRHEHCRQEAVVKALGIYHLRLAFVAIMSHGAAVCHWKSLKINGIGCDVDAT